MQHTPPRSPVQREVFADDYDEAEEAVETDDGQTAGDEEDDDVCAACGRQPTMRCPCLTASYCSRECQRAHWRTHKRACPLRRSRASSRTASEVSVAAEPVVAAQSTQNGDRRSAVEGEAYAASTAATYDGSTASGAEADTDEWSRSRAYSAASAPSTAAVYDGSAASGAGEDTDDSSRRDSPTRDDVTAARLAAARQAQAPADGSSTPRAESPQEKFVRVWSAADEAAAAEVFDLTTPHEARDFDAALTSKTARDLRGASPLAPATTTWARRPRPARLHNASARPSKRVRARRRSGHPLRRTSEGGYARVRRPHGAVARGAGPDGRGPRCAPPGRGLRDAGSSFAAPVVGASPTSSRWSPTPRRRSQASSSAGRRRARASITTSAVADVGRKRPRVETPTSGARPSTTPAFRISPGDRGDGARRPGGLAGPWARRGTDPVAGRPEALDGSSGRVYYANPAGAVQWTRPAVFDDDEEDEEDAPRRVSAARRSDEFDDGDDAPPREPPVEHGARLPRNRAFDAVGGRAALPGAASSPPSATRDVGVGGASASVRASAAARGGRRASEAGTRRRRSECRQRRRIGLCSERRKRRRVASVQSVGSGVAAATTASVGTEASPRRATWASAGVGGGPERR